MKTEEQVPVYIRIENGKTQCICHARFKGCKHDCERDIVKRDVFRSWQSTMKRGRYVK